MCFRPTSAAKAVECPNCGKKLPVVGGVKQKRCPFCKTDLPDETTATDDQITN